MRVNWTADKVDWLKQHNHLPRKQACQLFNQQFGLDVKQATFNKACHDKGLKAEVHEGQYRFNDNRLQYKKGQKPTRSDGTPLRALPIGTRRWRQFFTSRYMVVKVAQPNAWKLEHLVLWEQHHGPVPEGHIVAFIDNSEAAKREPSLDNLVLRQKGEQMRCVAFGMYRAPEELRQAVGLVASIETKRQELEHAEIQGNP